MATRTKPWTVSDPPSCAQNWTKEERERCVAAANDTLARGGTEEEAIFACIGAAGKGEEKQDEPHPHGEHECYCPECGHEETAEADVKCNTLKCPECGTRLRARTIGEQWEGRLGGRENNERRGAVVNPLTINIDNKQFEISCKIKPDGDVELGDDLVEIKAARWVVGADRNLPIVDRSWDGAAAKARIWAWAGFGGDNPNASKAKRCFLVYDASDPELKGSYKLPFADIVDGSPKAISGGLRNAASRLPQTDIPSNVQQNARAVLDGYFAKMPKKGRMPATLKLFEKDGETYWMAVSSTAFKDREKEIVSRKALDYAVQFGDATKLRGYLNLYHLQNVKLGTCDFSARVDKVLLEAGRWLDNEYANAVKGRLAKKDWGDGGQPAVSIEFWYDEDHVTDGVYDRVIIFNRALLKHKHAANQGTWFATTDDLRGEKDMSDKQDLVDWLGEELADKAWAEAEMHSKAIEQTGTEYKEVEMTDEAKDEVAEEVTEEAEEAVEGTAEADVDAEVAEETETAEVEDKDEAVQEIILTEEALNAIADEVESRLGMKGLADTLAALAAKVDGLAESDEEKVAEKVRRVPAETRVVIRESERKVESKVKKEEIIEPEADDEESGDVKDKIFGGMKPVNAA